MTENAFIDIGREPAQDETFDEWAIVELMGHRRLAGRIREVQLAGAGFLRLDIPAAGDDPGRTQYIAPGSVYALHPVDEATARAAAAQWRPTPVQRWELPGIPRSGLDDAIADLVADEAEAEMDDEDAGVWDVGDVVEADIEDDDDA